MCTDTGVPKIFPVIKKVITTVTGGAVNFHADVTPAPAITGTVLNNAGSTLVKPAVAIPNTVGTLVAQENPAVAIQGAVLSGTTPVNPAPSLAARATVTMPETPAVAIINNVGQLTPIEIPAVNMVQIAWDLVHNSFVVAMTNDAANVKSWTNPANAQGANNGTMANWDGSLAIAQTGKMHGTVAAQPRPADLIIDGVWMALWGTWSGLPVVDDLLSGLTAGYRIGDITALDVQTIRRGTSSGTDTGTEVRIDNGAGAFTDTLSTAVTWANIAALQFWAGGQTLVGVASQFNVDAMRLRVLAHVTDVL